MASAIVAPSLTDTHVSCAELKKKCEDGVEEMTQVVREIGEYQYQIYFYQEKLKGGELIDPHRIAEAQTYVESAKWYLDNRLWETVIRLENAIPKHFTCIFEWLRVQNEVLGGAINEWKKQKLHFLQGGPSEGLKSQYENLSKMISNIEGMALVLQNQIERYISVIGDLIGVNKYSEVHVSKCQALINDCNRRIEEVRKQMQELVQRSMIVFEEPPKIIRKGTENANKKKGTKITFEMEVRFLAGEKVGIIRENFELEASLISEQQAEDIVKKRINPCRDPLFPVGRLSFPKCTLKTTDSDGLVAKVVDARITNVERGSEDDASKVMYHLLYRIKNKKRQADNAGETYLPYWAISLPFSVVINATRQEKYKQALMFWHLAFDIDATTSLLKRTERVRWPLFFKALDIFFKRISLSDNKESSFVMQRGLETYEHYLKEKIGLKPDNMVTWEMFYRRKIDANSTFWEWFYPINDYVAKYSAYWESGLILGFASRLAVEELLENAKEPSLILKFSDSRPGKLVASYVNWTPKRLIEHVIFDEDEDQVFANKSPVECIRLSAKLQCISKLLPSSKPIADFYALETAIEKKEIQKKNDGYVKPGVVFVWGDKPTAPAIEFQLSPQTGSIDQASFHGNDDGSNQGADAASIYGSNGDFPAYRKFIESGSSGSGGSIRQNSSTSSCSQSPFGLSTASSPFYDNSVEPFSTNNTQQNGFSSCSQPYSTAAPGHQANYGQYTSPHQQPQQQAQYQQQWGQPSANPGMPTVNFSYACFDQQELPQQVEHMYLNQQPPQVDMEQALDQMQDLANSAIQNPYFAHGPIPNGNNHF